MGAAFLKVWVRVQVMISFGYDIREVLSTHEIASEKFFSIVS